MSDYLERIRNAFTPNWVQLALLERTGVCSGCRREQLKDYDNALVIQLLVASIKGETIGHDDLVSHCIAGRRGNLATFCDGSPDIVRQCDPKSSTYDPIVEAVYESINSLGIRINLSTKRYTLGDVETHK